MRTLLAATWVALLAANARATGIEHVRFIQQIGVDTLGRVAGSEADTQVEPSVAIDPGDSATVVALLGAAPREDRRRFTTFSFGCRDAPAPIPRHVLHLEAKPLRNLAPEL